MVIRMKKEHKAAFDIKGSAFTILMLTLRTNDLDAVAAELMKKDRQAPGFFRHAPVVLDVQCLDEDASLDLPRLLTLVQDQGFLPVGITGCTVGQQEAAAAMELALLTSRNGGRQEEVEETGENQEQEASESEVPELPPAPPALVVETPVRSGQRIAAEQGGLVVMSAVGSGAEVVAQGNIHVYGVLRGRAFAGCNGETTARIFCQSLEAELVSIAGVHLVSEDFPAAMRSKAVQIQLQGDHLHIKAL